MNTSLQILGNMKHYIIAHVHPKDSWLELLQWSGISCHTKCYP